MSALEVETAPAPAPHAPVAAGAAPDRLVGTSDELERLDHATVVSGGLLAGVVVAPGTRVEVHGVVRGPVHLGLDAVLHVVGEYAGDRFGDEGTVVVDGQSALRSATRPGVCLTEGTVLVDARGASWLLDAVGRPALVRPGRALTPGADEQGLLHWSAQEGRFVRR